MLNLRQMFVFIVILDSLILIEMRSIDQQRLFQMLKQQRSTDNDNEYVWFTRNIHPDLFDETNGNELADRTNLHTDDFLVDSDPNEKFFGHEHRNGN